MKKFILLIVIGISLIGCGGTYDKYDGLLVRDKDGNIYKLNHNIGDTYYITTFDNSVIKELNTLKGE